MELEFNKTTVRLGVLIFGVWMVSCFMSCQELKYAWSGKEAAGTVTKVQPDQDRFGRRTGYKVWYEFQNANTNRMASGSTIIDSDEVADYAVGRQIEIEYYGDTLPPSRSKGTSNRFWVLLFFGSLAAMIGVAVYMAMKDRPAKNPKKPKKRTQRGFGPASRGGDA
jgi:hypothetical protein